jgi:hypothetical protein
MDRAGSISLPLEQTISGVCYVFSSIFLSFSSSISRLKSVSVAAVAAAAKSTVVSPSLSVTVVVYILSRVTCPATTSTGITEDREQPSDVL